LKAGVNYFNDAFGRPKRESGNTLQGERCVAGGEAIVVPIRSAANYRNSIYTFNQSGTRLWAMVEAGRSGAEMATFLQTEYGLSAEEARLDTEEFLGELAREGLIDLA
jgi:hypothetical protein